MLKGIYQRDENLRTVFSRASRFTIRNLLNILLLIYCGCTESSSSSEECVPNSIFDPEDAFGYVPIEEATEIQQMSGYEKTLGDIIIDGTEFDSLNDLHCLTTISGLMSLRNNEKLSSLDGLGSLEVVGWSLTIYSNDKLLDIDGLRNLTSVGKAAETAGDQPGYGSLAISDCDSLVDLQGLANLSYLDGDLTITNNINLPTCEAMAIKHQIENNGWAREATICGNLSDECGSESCSMDQ